MSENKVVKPWGWYSIVDDDPTTKILCVNPGGMLSLQTHNNREETWIPMDTGLIAYIALPKALKKNGDPYGFFQPTATLMMHGNTYHVPYCAQHRLINPTERPIKLVEIMGGEYDENDIIRYQDIYERNEK